MTDAEIVSDTPRTIASIQSVQKWMEDHPAACIQTTVRAMLDIHCNDMAAVERALTAERERAERNEKELRAVRFYFLAARHAKTSAEKEHWIYEAERRAAIDAAIDAAIAGVKP